MRLSITKIKQNPGASREYSVSAPVFPNEMGEFRIKDPVRLNCTVCNEGEGRSRLEGNYEAEICYSCARCLAPCEKQVSGAVTALYSEVIPVMEEDEIDLRQLDGDDICPGELIASSIAFDLPMQLLCREDCRGLCPVCGADLNKEACTCAQDRIDPRWEKLKEFKFTPDR